MVTIEPFRVCHHLLKLQLLSFQFESVFSFFCWLISVLGVLLGYLWVEPKCEKHYKNKDAFLFGTIKTDMPCLLLPSNTEISSFLSSFMFNAKTQPKYAGLLHLTSTYLSFAQWIRHQLLVSKIDDSFILKLTIKRQHFIVLCVRIFKLSGDVRYLSN